MLFEDERLIVTQVIPITQDVVRYGCYKKRWYYCNFQVRVVYKDKRSYVKENNISNLAVAVINVLNMLKMIIRN